jgi:histidyl-tRNA synthetase
MKSRESKIPRFYDILEPELENTKFLHQLFVDLSHQFGFSEMRTTVMELRERYLKATDVHYSKIFEVHRVKEKTRYALQADLAISMSRFVADLPNRTPLKLIQMGQIYRDRPAQEPGFRREFQQILLGVWGIESLYVDAEIIAITYRGLKLIKDIEIPFIQISNFGIFNCLKENLATKIRFNGIDHKMFHDVGICSSDLYMLHKLFYLGCIPITEVEQLADQITDQRLKYQFKKVTDLNRYLKLLLPTGTKVYFSLADINGTGHYSGLNYQVFIQEKKKAKQPPFVIADGGRIDDLCTRLNNVDIQGVCMGIGVTVLAQIIEEVTQYNRVVILFDEDAAVSYAKIKKIKERLSDEDVFCSVLPLKRKKWGQLFRSSFYKNYVFVLVEPEKIEVRSDNTVLKQQVLKQIGKIP